MKYQNKVVMLTFFSLVSTAGLAASFADGDNLFLWTKGGKAAMVYSLDDIDKITFDDIAMSVWTNEGKTDYAYGNIELFTFRDDISPVTDVELPTVTDDVFLSYDHEAQLVRADCKKPFSGIVVCDMQGRQILRSGKKTAHHQLSLADLPQGVYVVKPLGTNKSLKIIK